MNRLCKINASLSCRSASNDGFVLSEICSLREGGSHMQWFDMLHNLYCVSGGIKNKCTNVTN